MNATCVLEAIGKAIRQQMTRAKCATLLLGAAGLFAVSNAKSMEIVVLGAQYSTDLRVTSWLPSGAETTTQTTTSDAPISNELRGLDEHTLAEAAADTFSVYTEAVLYSHATADTALSFTSLADQQGSVGLSFGGHRMYWGSGLVSLYDVTASQSLFSYGWKSCCAQPLLLLDGSTYPWAPGEAPSPLFHALEVELFASHIYTLTLHAYYSGGGDPGGDISINVSGLQPMAPIPEPSTYALMLAGLVAVALARKRRKANTGQVAA